MIFRFSDTLLDILEVATDVCERFCFQESLRFIPAKRTLLPSECQNRIVQYRFNLDSSNRDLSVGSQTKKAPLGAKNVSLTRNVALSSQSSHYSVSCMSAPSISECRVVVQFEIHRAGALRLACGKLSPCQSLQRRGSMTKPKGQLHGCALFVKLFSR